MRIQALTLSGALLMASLSASCGGPRDLVHAIRATGFECESLPSSQEMDESGTRWRIACGNARTYLTFLEDDGSICVTPLAYAEAPVTEIDREFQWPPQITEVVRCTGARERLPT